MNRDEPAAGKYKLWTLRFVIKSSTRWIIRFFVALLGCDSVWNIAGCSDDCCHGRVNPPRYTVENINAQWSQHEQEVGGPAVCLHKYWRTDFSSRPQENQRIYFIVQHSQTRFHLIKHLLLPAVTPSCQRGVGSSCGWHNVSHIFHQENPIVNKIHFYKGVLTKKLRKLQLRLFFFLTSKGQFNINHIATWLVSLSLWLVELHFLLIRKCWKWE